MMQTARDKIRELRALHDDGLLSLQEFDSRKNAILDAEFAPPSAAPGPAAPPPVAPLSVAPLPVASLMRPGTELGLA